MNEPVYRWECTICGASGESDSSEAARRTVNAHVAAAHPVDAAGQPATDPGAKRSS